MAWSHLQALALLALALSGLAGRHVLAQERAEIAVQLGHRSAITSVAVGLDGRTVLSGSLDGSAKLWDARSGRELKTFTGHQGSVLGVALSPDGRFAATAGRDRTLRIWDLSGRAAPRVVQAHDNIVLAVAFSRDSRRIVTSGFDRSVRLWESDGEPSSTLHTRSPARVLAFSSGGDRFALGLEDGSIQVHAYPSGARVAELHGHRSTVAAVDFSPDGQLIASAAHDGTVRLWSAQSATPLRSLSHDGRATGVAFSGDGQLLASSGQDGMVRLWNVADGAPKGVLRGHEGEITALAFSAREPVLASGGLDRAVRLWDVAAGRERGALRNRAVEVRGVAYSPDGRMLAVAGVDGRVRIWDALAGRMLRTLAAHQGAAEAVRFSPDGRLLATGGQDRVVRLWDWNRGQEQRSLSGHLGAVLSLDFSPDGALIASGSFDTTVRLWDAARGTLARDLRGHKASVRSVAFTADGRQLASGSFDDSVRLWDVQQGTSRVFTDHTNRVTTVAFSPDGRWLVSGGEDSTVRMRDLVAPGSPALTLMGHAAPVRSVVVSADGRSAYSVSVDGTLAVWETATGRRQQSFALGTGQLFALALAGGALAAGGDAGATTMIAAQDGHERARLFGFAGDDWVSITPEGFFNASEGGARYLNVRLGNEVHGLEQFTEAFYRPDRVQLALGGAPPPDEEKKKREEAQRLAREQADEARLEAERQRADAERLARERADQALREAQRQRADAERLAREQAEKARKEAERKQAQAAQIAAAAQAAAPVRINRVKPAPRVSILGLPRQVATEEIGIELLIDDAGGGIGEVRLYLNDTAVLHDSTRTLSVSPSPGGRFTYRVKLVNGRNVLRAVAFNADNTMQSADAVQEIEAKLQTVRRPSLHALVIGIEKYRNPRLELKYSVADARLFAQVIRERTKGLFAAVNVSLLTGEAETTRESLIQALLGMQKSVGPEDLFVFYVASHGTVDEGEYFLVTSNVGATSTARLRTDAIPQALLKDLLGNIPATKKFIVLDTCNAGQLGEAIQAAFLTRGLSEDRATKMLSRATGSTVLAAATSQQEALEGYHGHGLFTWVVTQGLAGKADADGDGFIKTTEIADYVDNEVPELAEQVFQHRQYPVTSPTGQQFPLVRSK